MSWRFHVVAIAVLAACAASVPPASPFLIEVLRTTSVADLDSLPEATVTARDGRVEIQAHFGLGGTGYQLTPQGTIEHGVIDIVVVARVPEDAAGLMVLTDYEYRLTAAPVEAGRWLVRLHHALDGEGDPEFVLEQEIVVGR